MWTRKELKSRGKEAMKRNYWKSVFVSLLLTLLMGSSAVSNFSNGFSDGYNNATESISEDELDYSINLIAQGEDGDFAVDDVDEVDPDFTFDYVNKAAAVITILSFVTMLLVFFAIGCVLDAFIANPIELGAARFFTRNQKKNAETKEVCYGFDHNYRNVVKTLFLKDLYTALWSLLFIIPGIVKMYEYRMIPYLLAENPAMDTKEAFALSKEMMQGQKWKTFVLDLSFLGWDILGMISVGIITLFYVGPYKWNTRGALYEAIKAGHPMQTETEATVQNV